MSASRANTTASPAPVPATKAPDTDGVEVRTVHSRDADSDELRAAEQLVKQSFGSEFRENDWRHGLGGTHVFVSRDTTTLLAHAAIVPRVILHVTNALQVGYVEAVAVRSDVQGRGLGRLLMDQVESIVRTNHQLGALNAVRDAVEFYLHRGWTLWTGATAAVNSTGGIVTTDSAEDRIMLLDSGLNSMDVDQSSVLTCDWRQGDLW